MIEKCSSLLTYIQSSASLDITCVVATLILSYISLLISSVETIGSYKLFKESTGLYSWRVHKTQTNYFNKKAINILYSFYGIIILNLLIILLIIVSFYLVYKWEIETFLQLHVLITLMSLVLYYRIMGIINGANHKYNLIFISISLAILLRTEYSLHASLIFISICTLLCYFTAGIYKIFERKWRNGEYLLEILNTTIFSSDYVKNKINTNPKYSNISKYASIVFITWEISSIIAIFSPQFFFIPYLLLGVIFHLTVAKLMGLNTFLWSYVASYPAVIFTYIELNQLF